MANIFLANSRIQKLKKLSVLSREIIKEFGMRYFLRICFEEIKKQKLSIFSPDKTPRFDFDEFLSDYDSFKKKHMMANSLDLMKKNISTFSKKPRFTFLLINNGTSIQNITESISSILNQSYENFDLHLVNCPYSIMDNLSEINPKIPLKEINSNKLDEIISKIQGEFVVILHSGIAVQDDLLYRIAKEFNQNPDSDVFYTDEDYLDENNVATNVFFKPDWSPYLFHSMNYLGDLCIVRKNLIEQVPDLNVTQNDLLYELILRCYEITDKFSHVPHVLFSSKKTPSSESSEYVKSVMSNHLKKLGKNANVNDGLIPGTYRVRYILDSEPKVSIIIPTKDKKNLLKRCIDSIENNTSYKNWEIIIVDNDSKNPETTSYLKSLPYKIIPYTELFNFSKMNNLAVTQATGDYLLFLNDDTAAIDPDWLTEMVSICQQDDVGAVGPKLVHSDNTIQHAGMVFLKTGAGFHPFQRYQEDDPGYFNFINVIRDLSAVTGACLLTKKEIFEKVGEFDNDFDLYYGDSDLCLKIRDSGFKIVYTPYAKLLHDGSSSIRKHTSAFFAVENHQHFIKKWPHLKNGDPFYNPNLGWNYQIGK
ncbi:MAG: glycosyltransferase family 2 protein [Nitrosarchaeum sp.]|nr:glycosyltransferase family 2 protein [Nitrosarchaeum sp.]